MNHFNQKKSTSVILATALLVSALPVSVSAMEANTDKEEVVYVNLGNDGSVREINVVNIFGENTEGVIIDYGKYLDVRNMTTTDKIDFSGDAIKINSSAEKLYYEGKLESALMPWDIQIRYFLDGKEYSAEEIAGKSGEIKITIRIAQNQKYRGDFYDNYALQASLSFDTDKCKNIVAPDATVANVGSNKQLTYTILPGKGADIEITAEVSEFEMDGISINGIPLNLNIEVDDEELMGQVTELLDAISQLDDGAAELQDGASDLQDGAQSDLKSGVNDLKDGAEQLHRGAADMKTDDMLYSGGNGTGLSFYIKYAEGSTEDNPTVIAKGVDENGNEFEQTIHINKINPKCATVVEMRALEAHLGVDKNGGLSSLPLETGEMGLHDRADFMDMFQKQISDMRLLGQQKLAAYYQYSMQAYWDFMNKK